MNNIVIFPKQKIEQGNMTTINEVKDRIEDVNLYHVDESVEILQEMVSSNLELLGFHLEPSDEYYAKDFFLAIESLRSFLLKYHNIDHPIQKIAEELFIKNDDNTYTMKTDEKETE